MIGQVLLAGQILAIVLLYIFVWRVMRAGARDIFRTSTSAGGSGGAATQNADESTIIPAAQVARAREAAGMPQARIVVITSPHLRTGVPISVGEGITFGRSSDNAVVLRDDYVSSHHARLQPPSTLIDLDSTNGTVVNGQALHGRVRLKNGDQFALGESVFRFEALP